MQPIKHYLLNLVHQIRICQDPSYTFEELDKLGISFRAQNEACNMAENNKLSGNIIVNTIMGKEYLFRYPEGTNTEYIKGFGLVSEDMKVLIR